MNRARARLLAVVVLLATAGCLGGTGPGGTAGELEAEVVDSVPEDATVVDYEASALAGKPTIRLLVDEAVEQGRAVVTLDPERYETVSEHYESLNARYVRHQDTVVRVTLLTEQ